jgi:hypothetical protein
MPKSDILKFCKHVEKREKDHGVEDAFRFLKYWDGKEMVEAAYGTRVADERAAARAIKQSQARAAGKRTKRNKAKPMETGSVNTERVPASGQAAAAKCGNRPKNVPSDQDFSNIDPVLLASTTSGDRIQGPLPAYHLPAADLIINEGEMQILRPLGYTSIIPLNGPNEGPPLYQIPAEAVDLLRQQQETGGGSIPAGGEGPTSKTPKTRMAKKRLANADAQTIAEGKRLLKSTRTTRSGSKRGRQYK